MNGVAEIHHLMRCGELDVSKEVRSKIEIEEPQFLEAVNHKNGGTLFWKWTATFPFWVGISGGVLEVGEKTTGRKK